MKKPHIVVVGGGIAGLATCYFLTQRSGQSPVQVTLLEKGSRLGGNIWTEYPDGFVVEAGPDCFIAEKPWAAQLVREIGLGDEIIGTIPENNHTYILSRGRLHPLPEGFMLLVPTRIWPFIKSSLISPAGKIRMLLDLFIPPSPEGDVTLASFIIRRLGREALEKIAEPLIAGIHAADPARMSLKATFPRFLDLEKTHGSLIKGMLKLRKNMQSSQNRSAFLSLKRGLYSLVEKLEEILHAQGVIIRKGVEVKEVTKLQNQWCLASEQETFYGDILILALPAHTAGVLLKNVHSTLVQQLSEIPFTSTVTVSAAFRKSETSKELKGYGFLVPASENTHLLAATWTSSKFPFRAPESHHLIRCFGGGYRNENFVFKNEDEIASILLEEFCKIMNWTARPEWIKVYRWPKAMPQYEIGHQDKVKRIEEVSSRAGGLFLTGSSYRGIGISDCIRDARETASKVFSFLLNEN